MKVSQLTLEETQNLIESYQSQLKTVEFQTAHLQKVLGSLTKHLDKKLKQKSREDARLAKAAKKPAASRSQTKKVVAEDAPAAKVSAPAKSTRKSKPTTKRKVDGRKNRKITGGYRLSEWDSFLLDTLKDQNRALINSEILDYAEAYNKSKGKAKLTNEILRRKIAASMHKLANKRGEIVKTTYSGKGYAYALPEWTRAGKLKKEFAR